jgi:hypothetical protein
LETDGELGVYSASVTGWPCIAVPQGFGPNNKIQK